MDVEAILQQIADGSLSVTAAMELLSNGKETNLEFARVDTDRLRRRGLSEVVFAPGKTADQIVQIITAMKEAGQNVLVSRVSPEQAKIILEAHPDAVHHPAARALSCDTVPLPEQTGRVAVVTAGTSDIEVAEEAALTAERMGAVVDRINDIGIAGLHRLLGQLERIRSARVVIVAAGMEGALPSVLGGLIDKPIIAIPTSVGYGTGINGLSALMTMLNSCVPGITVVNIDNGFGAGVAAAMINRLDQD
jgi:NCAIR mutase (PurE)-related protein